jgi:hypothetical protein
MAYLSRLMPSRGLTLERAPQVESGEAQVFYLKPGDVHTLPGKARRIKVLAGEGWLAVNGRDIMLLDGQSAELPKGRYPAVISALYHRGLAYRVE